MGKHKHLKNYLVSKIIKCISDYPHTEENNNLYSYDTGFIVCPIKIKTNTHEDNRTIYRNIITLMDIKTKTIDAFNIFKSNDLGVEIKLDTISFPAGIKLSKLIALSKEFNTEDIFVSGDGHDYEMSELTSNHHSEIILRISLNGMDREKEIEKYIIWRDK